MKGSYLNTISSQPYHLIQVLILILYRNQLFSAVLLLCPCQGCRYVSGLLWTLELLLIFRVCRRSWVHHSSHTRTGWRMQPDRWTNSFRMTEVIRISQINSKFLFTVRTGKTKIDSIHLDKFLYEMIVYFMIQYLSYLMVFHSCYFIFSAFCF